MRTEIRKVTPNLAKLWLQQNNNNRPIRNYVVNNYAEQMKNGKWDLTGQGITFDLNGDLLDGQHRLNAIIKSGVSVEMLIIWDAPKSYGYDCGLTRSYSDRILMKDGVKVDRFKVSVGNLALKIIHDMDSKESKTVLYENKAFIPDTEEIKKYCLKYLDMLDYIFKITSSKKYDTLCVTRSAPVRLAILCALVKYNDEIVVRDWVEEVKTGIQNRNLRSAILYRNWELGASGYIMDRIQRLKMAQLSLKKYIEEDDVKKLKQTSDFSIDIPRL